MKPIFMCLIIGCSLLAIAGTPQRRTPSGAVDLTYPNTTPAPSKRQRPDTAKLKRDSEELAKLAQSVPAEIDQVAKGMLPTELTRRLKRIEILSKDVRRALSK